MARFVDIPDVDFMGGVTLADLKKEILEYYTEELQTITGSNAVTVADERKAELYAAAQIFYQIMQTANDRGKQNLLKYARGAYLDNIVLSRITRKAAEYAVTTVRFTLSAVRPTAVVIPAGTRVTTPARLIYFATDETTEIPAGTEYIDIMCTAVEGGNGSNDLAAGELNTLVDPIAYVASVSNTDITQGGADEESDDALAERFFNARYEHSTTGAEEAYIYYTKSYSSTIDDVKIENPQDAEIDIYITLEDRELATESFLNDLAEYIKSVDIKALTDKITVHNVTRVEYEINATYTVYTEDISKLSEIQTAVAAAVEEYKSWQCEKIGRDINTQKLISCMIEAGAATVTITSPTTATVGGTEIAHCTATNVTYEKAIEA